MVHDTPYCKSWSRISSATWLVPYKVGESSKHKPIILATGHSKVDILQQTIMIRPNAHDQLMTGVRLNDLNTWDVDKLGWVKVRSS